VTITIGVSSSATTIPYAYTIQSGDSFSSIVDGLVALINAKNGDPNVIATADVLANEVVLTAKVPGVVGNSVTVATSISSGAQITATASSANLSGGGSAATIAPGSLVSFLGTNMSDQVAVAPEGVPQLPLTLGGVQVYFNGVQSPLLFVSPTQINAQVPFAFQYSSTGTLNAWARIQRADGTIIATDTVALTLVGSNPGIFAGPGKDPRPATAVHSSNYATGVISVDGTIKAGNIGTICIGSSTALTATATYPTGCTGGRMYNYRVQASDSLGSVQKAFVALLNQDPQISASASSEFTRILLQAKVAGSAGNGISFQQAVSTGSDLLLTVIGPAPPSPGVGAELCCASEAGSPITINSPALPGETVIIYATGLGVPQLAPALNPYLLSGQPYQGPAFNTPAASVSSLIDSKTANVLRAELAPGMVGIYQVYLQLPSSLTTDPQAQLTIAQNIYVSNVVTLPILATPELSSVTCTPTSLNSNGTSTCSVTLTVAVPSTATTVSLSSSSAQLTVPSSVSVPAGTTSATFSATTGTVSASGSATITATLGTSTQTAVITLAP